jgi:8-hydroxy-5-deazaflavin:NADPH oxidoreductase
MNIAVIGAGQVGGALAQALAEAGHAVVIAEREPGSAQAALARSSRLTAAPTEDAVRGAELVLLATPYGANASVIGPLAEALAGKVIVDCTNPVGPGLSHGLKSERSGSEALQALAPAAKVVKAFTIYGFENLERPEFPAYNVKPAMMFCGDDGAAKAKVATLITDCGFEPLDVGGLVQALHLEHMTLLWVRMVRMNGHSPRLTWAALRG